ncbi:hypothetical protein F5Y14DRAFT_432721 [Nemania sp. NC0429]|nr:hypothetical protein F5Y14DRAFT_432721 [Nemania sp. NC0429]
MRYTLPTIALWAIGASAAVLPPMPEVKARQDDSAIWYAITENASCNLFGCNAYYYIFGPPNTVPGAPAFAARCYSVGGCTNTVAGSDVHATILSLGADRGPLTITQTFTVGSKTTTLTGVSDWKGDVATAFTIAVSETTA